MQIFSCKKSYQKKPSDFIRLFAIQSDSKFVLCCRVSGYDQKKHLTDQENNLTKATDGQSIKTFKYIGTGSNCSWLTVPGKLAIKHNAILLAETTCRFVRHPLYNKTNQEYQAEQPQLEYLQFCTRGAILMTHLHPDASLSEIRSYHTKRGLQKNTWIQRAYNLHLNGISFVQIARIISKMAGKHIGDTTIARWVNKYKTDISILNDKSE